MRVRTCGGHNVQSFLGEVDGAIATGLEPTLALVFCSLSIDLDGLRRGLGQRGIAVAGATTAGEIANASIREETCVALLMEADPAAFAIKICRSESGASMFDPGCQLGRFAVERFRNPVVLGWVSGIRTNAEPVVPGVFEGAGRVIPLFGGVAGDDLKMASSYVFSATDKADEALLGLIFDGDRFQVQGIVTSGWQAVGVAKSITRAEGSTVYTIDNCPALEVYKRYLDIEPSRSAPGELTCIALGVQYPLSVQRENGTAVIRAPLFYQPMDGSLIFSGSVPEGSRVKFCIPPSVDIVQKVVADAEVLHRRMPQADACILIFCKARHLALGPLAEDEVQEIYNLWGAPAAGLFSYGEIGPNDPHGCDYHTETCTLVVLRQINT